MFPFTQCTTPKINQTIPIAHKKITCFVKFSSFPSFIKSAAKKNTTDSIQQIMAYAFLFFINLTFSLNIFLNDTDLTHPLTTSHFPSQSAPPHPILPDMKSDLGFISGIKIISLSTIHQFSVLREAPQGLFLSVRCWCRLTDLRPSRYRPSPPPAPSLRD